MAKLVLKTNHRFSSGFVLDVDIQTDVQSLAIFGPSGSGKSTLLSILAGIVRPNSGYVSFEDSVVLDSSKGIYLPPEKRTFGFVFQDHLLFPHMSVAKNLQYGFNRRKEAPRGITFDKVIQILELGALLDRFPRTLSGGQQQRVSLGRALLSGPKLLLMDEPLSSLDRDLKLRVLEYLERILAEWDIPLVYVSHDLEEVRKLADYALVLHEGELMTAGPPDEVFSEAVSIAPKLGTPLIGQS